MLIREDAADDEIRAKEKEIVLETLVDAVRLLEEDAVGVLTNGLANGGGENLGPRLRDKVGDLVAGKILELGKPALIKAALGC